MCDAHGSVAPEAIGGFAGVVQNEGQAGEPGGSRRHGGQPVGKDEQFVGQSGVGHGGQATQNVFSQDPLWVEFPLDPMPDAQ